MRADGRLELAGELGFADAAAVWRALCDATARSRRPREPELVIDLGRATRVDGAIVSLVVALRARLIARGVRCEIAAGSDPLRSLVHLYHGDEPPPPPAAIRRRERGIARLGAAIEPAVAQARRMVGFLGELVGAIGAIARRPGTVSWRDLPGLIVRAGTDGIPIVVVLNFLVGFVMAYQTARQLKLFGANIYAADIVGLSVTRELAPLMTAIIIMRPVRRGVRRRARHDAGVRRDRRAAHDGLRAGALPGRAADPRAGRGRAAPDPDRRRGRRDRRRRGRRREPGASRRRGSSPSCRPRW